MRWLIDNAPAASDYDLDQLQPFAPRIRPTLDHRPTSLAMIKPRPLDGAIVQRPQRIENNCDINHFLEDGALHRRDQAERRRDHPEDRKTQTCIDAFQCDEA